MTFFHHVAPRHPVLFFEDGPASGHRPRYQALLGVSGLGEHFREEMA